MLVIFTVVSLLFYQLYLLHYWIVSIITGAIGILISNTETLASPMLATHKVVP
jgi:hypothetical protein